MTELARIRTWNLLLRRQTRYPLRHKYPVLKIILNSAPMVFQGAEMLTQKAIFMDSKIKCHYVCLRLSEVNTTIIS